MRLEEAGLEIRVLGLVEILHVLSSFSSVLTSCRRLSVVSRRAGSLRRRLVAVARRDCLDDAQRFEAGALRDECGIDVRRSVEDEEAQLVLWNVDRVLEPDAGARARQRVRSRARTPLTSSSFPRATACKKRLDQIARHTVEARGAATARKRQND
jgi:hypothetical protein